MLAVVSGATDATAFLALGGAFTSVMTGNMVLLGVAAGEQDPDLARHAAVAVACFALGVALGTRLLARSPAPRGDGWPLPPGFVRVLWAELALYGAFAAGWQLCDAAPAGEREQVPLLALTAVALGMQSAAMLRVGAKGLSTTYLTGTLTTLVARLASGGALREVSVNAAVLTGLIAGAAAGGLLFLHAPHVCPLLPLALLAAALAGALRAERTRRGAG